MTTLATFGEWTFSHQLANTLVRTDPYVQDAELLLLDSPREVIQSLQSRDCDVGLIPFRNNYANTNGVPSSHRMLLEEGIHVHRLISHDVVVQLAAHPGTTLDSLHTILLMPVLEKQCSQFLYSLPSSVKMESENVGKTADAMSRVAELGVGYAALGTAEAAHRFNLEVIRAGVQNPQNVTTFLLLARQAPPPGGTRLVAFEVDGSVESSRVIGQVVQPVLEASEWLVAGTFVLEDPNQKESFETHLVIGPVNPKEGRPLEGLSPLVRRWRDLGTVKS